MSKQQDRVTSVELNELDLELVAGGMQKANNALNVASQFGLLGGSGGNGGNGSRQQSNGRR